MLHRHKVSWSQQQNNNRHDEERSAPNACACRGRPEDLEEEREVVRAREENDRVQERGE